MQAPYKVHQKYLLITLVFIKVLRLGLGTGVECCPMIVPRVLAGQKELGNKFGGIKQ